MNLLEYVQTLSSDISIAEKIALTKAWKDKNEDPIEQEVIETSVEEVKPSKFNEDGSFNLSSFENEDSKNLAKSANEKKKKAHIGIQNKSSFGSFAGKRYTSEFGKEI